MCVIQSQVLNLEEMVWLTSLTYPVKISRSLQLLDQGLTFLFTALLLAL